MPDGHGIQAIGPSFGHLGESPGALPDAIFVVVHTPGDAPGVQDPRVDELRSVSPVRRAYRY
ncbi:MAG: hypothetical protein AVDCRST_MAG25-274 [uncultured Rubrobacteraceae bacterium]|uniref:Uncharacterized protein n=1 Tax=uncultured Rubrobacteraceae bacterium TaxID=349277 RepID=A0A6J4QWH6_9ACTN|nr:MAG: hypothetical protein AVDCRST_MAG25-274 [uncultured Rubrobacteraceae bacterium]